MAKSKKREDKEAAYQEALEALVSAPCCTPVPDVRFVNSEVVSVHMHHRGINCGGRMDLYPLAEWWLEVDTRADSSTV